MAKEQAINFLRARRAVLRGVLEPFRRALGYDRRNWLRVAQIEAFEAFIDTAKKDDVLEVSPGWNSHWRSYIGNSYRCVDYPAFDICRNRLSQQFDLIIADQVLEHCPQPLRAVMNLWSMTAPGGYTLVATPFLFRVHARPGDYTRWTEEGLKQLLIEGGFPIEGITTAAWGNKQCARAHIGGPVQDYGFGKPMQNDPEYPMMVWAFARR